MIKHIYHLGQKIRFLPKKSKVKEWKTGFILMIKAPTIRKSGVSVAMFDPQGVVSYRPSGEIDYYQETEVFPVE